MNQLLKSPSRNDCSVEPVKASHLDRVTSQLQEELSQLSKTVERLYSRLEPVLRSEPESPNKEEGKDKEYLVPAANVLRAQVHSVTAINSRLQRLIALLEV